MKAQVLFAEPVVITACEFIEQNASSTSQAVALAGYVCLAELNSLLTPEHSIFRFALI